MKKALLLASVASMIEQFNMDNIRILKEAGYKVDVMANFAYGSTMPQNKVDALFEKLKNEDVTPIHVSIPRKISDIKGICSALRDVKHKCETERYSILHCHSPIGGVVARLAAKGARKKYGTRVLYTGHGFHFFKGAPLINWLLYFPMEWLCSFLTDTLITINEEDYARAKKRLYARNTVYIPGIGVDTEKFSAADVNREEVRTALGVSEEDVMLLSVGELSKRKNQGVILEALGKLQNKRLRYFIVGMGAKESDLRAKASALGIEENVHFLGFRSDIPALCRAADVFCFPSLHEGLPVALMEAMGAGTACLASAIRGNTDLIKNGEGGYLYDPQDVEGFAAGMEKLAENAALREKMGQTNREAVKGFDIRLVSEKMQKIYAGESA